MLRTVAEVFAFPYDNVQYFPSYEIAMNSNRDITWADDGRHLQGPVQLKIMNHFVESFVE